MADSTAFPEVPGASDLFAWFGYWPTFHDGEVLSVRLERTGSSSIRVHTFQMTGQIDGKGHYMTQKHVVVTFWLDGIDGLQITGFNHQNVLGELTLTKSSSGYDLELGPCYGASGSITAASIRIEFEPGIPSNSVYSG